MRKYQRLTIDKRKQITEFLSQCKLDKGILIPH
jgi:hypothetical protein